MSSLSSALCLKCEKIYDSSTRRMCTGICDHSMCEPCFDKKLSTICPTCKKGNAFAVKKINFEAMNILDQLQSGISMMKLKDGVTDKESLAKGPCCECREHCNKLRLCVDCSVESELLVKSENGNVKLTTDTVGEHLETKILRIRSSAFCAECKLEKNLHETHTTMLVKDIKDLADTTEILNALSVVSLSLNKIKSSTEEFTHIRTPIRALETGNQLIELALSTLLTERGENNTPAENGLLLFGKLLAKLAGSWGESGFMTKVYQKIDEKLEEAKSPEYKRELLTAKEMMRKYREHCSTMASFGKLDAQDFQFIYDILESGTFQTILAEFQSESGDGGSTVPVQDLLNISKDLRRSIPFKIPREYEKYADLAESCCKFFIG